jgi:hypothetical protein
METIGEKIIPLDLERRLFEIAEGNHARPIPDPEPLGIADIMNSPEISNLPGHIAIPEGHAIYLNE